MTVVLHFLFPAKSSGAPASGLLLALRILFGVLLLVHGLQKWVGYEYLATDFPDPYDLGRASLLLAIFAEVFCAAGFVAGLCTRLALIPMIVTMATALFVVHAGDPFAARELAAIYLAVFAMTFVSGPGDYSLDHLVGRMLARRASRRPKTPDCP